MLEQTFTIGQAVHAVLLCVFVVGPAMLGWAVILGFLKDMRSKSRTSGGNMAVQK